MRGWHFFWRLLAWWALGLAAFAFAVSGLVWLGRLVWWMLGRWV